MKSLIALIMTIALCLVGCSPTNTVNLITSIADSAMLVATTLQATKAITPAEAALVSNYANQVATAVQQVPSILAKSESSAAKGAEIANLFVGIAVPDIPGLDPVLASTITSLSKLVVQLVQQYTVTGPVVTAQASPSAAKAHAIYAAPAPRMVTLASPALVKAIDHMSGGDEFKLEEAAKVAAQVKAKLATIR